MIRNAVAGVGVDENRRYAAGTRVLFYIRRIDPQIRDYEWCCRQKYRRPLWSTSILFELSLAAVTASKPTFSAAADFKRAGASRVSLFRHLLV